MWKTCKTVNFSLLLFATPMIGQTPLTQEKHPFKMEFQYIKILLRKRPFCRFMHSLCKNENIPMWGKHFVRITEEIAFHLTRIIT